MPPGPAAVEMSNMNRDDKGASGSLYGLSGSKATTNIKDRILKSGARSLKKEKKNGRQSLLQNRTDDFSESADGTSYKPDDIMEVHTDDTSPVPSFRTVRSGANNNMSPEFCSNVVVTSKYTCLSFLPLFLFEEFSKVANLYFLIVSCLQTVKAISNTNGLPATAPVLVFILAVDAVFAILEDKRRHKADRIANNRQVDVWQGASGASLQDFCTKSWGELRVGDFVYLRNHDPVPADVLLLAVSEHNAQNPTGVCYVETKSLDGETNLKLRQAMESTVKKFYPGDGSVPAGTSGRNDEEAVDARGRVGSDAFKEALRGIECSVVCEQPNVNVNKFTGTLHLDGSDTAEPIPYNSMLLRGVTLRNTAWAFGMVVNTGAQTKVMMAMTKTPFKTSSVDKLINKQIFRLVCLLVTCCIISATLSTIFFNSSRYSHAWYLGAETVPSYEWVINFFYFFLLMYQFIPVSLYVSMGAVKFMQGGMMEQDLEMYHEQTDTPALVRNMLLNEELGQVSHIFSDKTGTLTCNVMDFRKCSINGISYGKGTTEIGIAALRRAGKLVPSEVLEEVPPERHEPFVNFVGDELMDTIRSEGTPQWKKAAIEQFFTHLAVCHTVIPERVTDRTTGKETTHLSASSPDEQALVAGAKFFGYEFFDRSPGKVKLKLGLEHTSKEEREFDILNVLEFNSARKRMSVIARDTKTGTLSLYCKGADNVILERLKSGQDRIVRDTVAHTNEFAQDGLRTLCIAVRSVDDNFYADWEKRYELATGDLQEIQKRKDEIPNAIDDAMEEMERDLTLLGCTAIEDKLQKGVPQAIEDCARGGIKVWVLTGDKEETAINIGFACRLLTDEMKQLVINSETHKTAQNIREALQKQCNEVQQHPEQKFSLVIDGEALDMVFDPSGGCQEDLLEFGDKCVAVVCCRVSPAQKAQMVNLVKNGRPESRCLSIGDGANDVAMIQQAHIGVGISGQEGLQAVNSSDYAIAQFRFLKRLLLVHGRWNYRRMSKLVCYMFYKNILLVMAQWIFSFMSGYSGQKYYLETGIQWYNVLFTSVPVIALGVLDQDIPAAAAELRPEVYRLGLRNRHFNDRIFWGWIAGCLWEAAAIFITSFAIVSGGGRQGTDLGMWQFGALVFTQVVIVANLRLAFHQYIWPWFQFVFYIFGFAAWYGWASFVSSRSDMGPFFQSFDWYQIFPELTARPVFWLSILLGAVSSTFWPFLMKGWKRAFDADEYHVLQELVKLRPDVYKQELTPSSPSLNNIVNVANPISTSPNGGHPVSTGVRETRARSSYAPDEESHRAEAHFAKPLQTSYDSAHYRAPLQSASQYRKQTLQESEELAEQLSGISKVSASMMPRTSMQAEDTNRSSSNV